MGLQTTLLESFDGEDDLGVVIRTHIIIEQYLNKLLDGLVADNKYIRDMDLDYSQTVKLTIALGLDPRLHSALSALGKIRNDFAHKLVPSISTQVVNNLYTALDADTKNILNNGVKVASRELDETFTHKGLSPKQQFVNIAAVLAAALQKACKEVGITT